ncbi:MAG: DUF3228 family protein [Pseudomonadota bacterium]
MTHVAMTDFALRNWQDGASTRIIGLTPDELVALCNTSDEPLVDGYAPFCKHIFVENNSATRAAFAPITDETRPFLRSGYVARRAGERAVLERWFEEMEAPRANWLDVILYSHDQLLKEAHDFPEEQPVPDCDWGIVSIIGVLEPSEPPMPPITQMRNALGRAEGGSGVAIDDGAYNRAVAFWDTYAAIR